MKEEKLNFGDEIKQNQKSREGSGKAKIDLSVWQWAEKKLGGKGSFVITNQEISFQKQEIKIHKLNGKMDNITLTIKPLGDYILVVNNKGGGMIKSEKKFFKV